MRCKSRLNVDECGGRMVAILKSNKPRLLCVICGESVAPATEWEWTCWVDSWRDSHGEAEKG